MFSIHALLFFFLFCLLHFPNPAPQNSFWNFVHVLDNKFIWISGFELFVDHWRRLASCGWCMSKNERENIKISSSSAASNDGEFSFHSISWIPFFTDAHDEEAEKWKSQCTSSFYFTLFPIHWQKPQIKNLCGTHSENLARLLILIY